MLHQPDYEIIYYRNKISYHEIKSARKDFPQERRFILIISILVGGVIPSIFSNLIHGIAKSIFYLLTIVVAYSIIAPISLCMPKEWVIGSRGIYLPSVFKRRIEWHDIKEIKDASHGLVIVTHGICRKTYLITKEKEKIANIFKLFLV